MSIFDMFLDSALEGASGGFGGAISSAVGGLLGGKKKKGPSAAKQMAMQIQAQYDLARNLPTHQVAGLRAAGLNPLLAVTNGLPSGQMPTSGAQDDRAIGLQEASVRAQVANQAAQAKLYNAQAEKTEAETETESHRPMNVAADTGAKMAQPKLLEAQTYQALSQGNLAGATKALQEQLKATEDWRTRTATVETFMKNFEYELSLKNLPPRQMAEVRKLTAEARSAETEADLNESLRELERKMGVASKAGGLVGSAASAARNLSNVARGSGRYRRP